MPAPPHFNEYQSRSSGGRVDSYIANKSNMGSLTPSEFLAKTMPRPKMDAPTFESPGLAAVAGSFLAYMALGKSGVIKAIRDSSKILSITGQAGDALRRGRSMFRDAQVQTMIPVTGRVPGSMKSQLGRHDDIELFQALDEAVTGRERLARMSPEGQRGNLRSQVDAELRSDLASRFAQSERAGHKSMTVRDVLDMHPDEAEKLFGRRGLDLLKTGMDEGLIHADTALGAGVFKGADGGVLRTDMFTARSIGRAAKGLANQFQIPYFGIKFGDLISSPIQHVIGRTSTMKVVGSVGDNTKPAVLIGKKLFNIGQKEGDTALSLHRVEGEFNFGVGSFEQGVLARRGQLPGQSDRIARSRPSFRDDPIGALKFGIQHRVFGVGKAWQTQRSLWGMIKGAYKNRMDGTLVHDELIPLAETGFKGRTKQALGDALGVHPVTGAPIRPGERGRALIDNPNLQKMGLADKIRSVFGMKIKGAKYIDRHGVEVVHDAVNAGGSTRARMPTVPGENIVRDGAVQAKTAADGFAYKAGASSTLQDTLHFGVNRLNDLFGYTFGVGMVPQRNTLIAASSASFAFMGLSTGLAAIGYADYMTGRTVEAATLGGIDSEDAQVSSLAMDTYSGLRTGLQHVRKATGISALARGAEDAAPGIISSDLSSAARLLAGPALGMLFKSRYGFAAGVGASVLFGDDFTAGLTETPKEVQDILSGEQEVEMRKGRYWEFGKQAFKGGKIGHYGPGAVARARSKYKYSDTLYGSEQEYYSNETWLPTPTNLFGLRKLIQGSLLPDRHALSRPYPGASSDRTVNAAMTEAGYSTPDRELMAEGRYATAFRGKRELDLHSKLIDTPMGGIRIAGHNEMPASNHVQSMLYQNVTRSLDQYTEQFGIYKFLTESGSRTLFGNEVTSKRLASADFMSSPSRAFYDEDMGGLLTLSELTRRFMLSGDVRAQRSAYNPLPNLMPDFLPGSRSQYEEDQSYPIDFHTGDPYGKIKHGEARLPGAARERIHRLHSGTPGVYDAMDRLLVLADVAPGSESYKHYKAIVDGWSMSGVLDAHWEEKYQRSQSQVAAKLRVHDFKMRPSDAIAQGELEGKEYNFAQKATGFLWEGLSREVIPRIGAAVPMIGNFVEDKLLATRDAQETYLNREIYDTDEYNWAKPYSTMVRPMVDSLIAKDPASAAVGGGVTASIFAANPASKALFAVAGALFTGGAATGRALTVGDEWVPDHVTERRDVDAYFDSLEYMRHKRAEQTARTLGLAKEAEKYRDLSKTTVAGIDYSLEGEQFKFAAMKALPQRERAYLEEFFYAKKEDRASILAYLPDYVKPVYEAAYAKQGDERYAESLAKLTSETAIERISNTFSSKDQVMPGEDWAGWNPNVSWDAVRYETAMSMGNNVAADMHRSGLTFVNQDPDKMAQVAAMDLDVTSHFEGSAGRNPYEMFTLEGELRALGMQNIQITNNMGLSAHRLTYNSYDNRLAETMNSINRVM